MKSKPKKTPAHRRMSSRELREKMSHDPLMDSINWVRKVWTDHGTKLTWGLLALVIVFFGVRFLKSQQRSKIESASMMFDVAYEDYVKSLSMQGTERADQEKKALESADTLIASFPGTPRAVHGLLLKADILYRQGNYEQALENYDTAAQQAEKRDSIILARIGVAQCRASLEGAGAGIEDFESLLAEYPSSNFSDQINFQLARLYESEGNAEKALEHYGEISEDSPFLDDQTKRRIEFLRAPVVSFGDSSA